MCYSLRTGSISKRCYIFHLLPYRYRNNPQKPLPFHRIFVPIQNFAEKWPKCLRIGSFELPPPTRKFCGNLPPPPQESSAESLVIRKNAFKCIHMFFNSQKKCMNIIKCTLLSQIFQLPSAWQPFPYVSVNSNWVHPPGNPRKNVFERVNPGHSGNFLSPGQKMMVEFPGVGQNFPKLEETAL